MTRASLAFFVRSFCIFAVVLFLIPTSFYPPFFRALGNTLYGSFGADRIVRYEPFEDPLGMRDTSIRVGSNRYGPAGYGPAMHVNSVREGYVPLVTFLALVVATPVAWRRRLRALWVGALVVQAFVLARMAAQLAAGFSRVRLEDGYLLDVPAFWRQAFGRADQLLGTDLQLTYVAPVLVWILVLVRMSDLQRLRAPAHAAEALDASPPLAAPRTRSSRTATQRPAR